MNKRRLKKARIKCAAQVLATLRGEKYKDAKLTWRESVLIDKLNKASN